MKYAILGTALLGLFLLMVTPIGNENIQTQAIHFGSAYLVAFDSTGNEIFSQTIHNNLVDEGEQFILDNIFVETNNVATGETDQMGAICITNEGSFAVSEARTASSFDGAETITGNNCVFGEATITNSGGVQKAVIGPLSFVEATNIAGTEIITGIGICQANTGTGDYDSCETGGTATGLLLAAVNVSDVTVGTGETVQITYTLDLSSTNS